ncbi:unnamed protein product, partial [Microthlaspi erraticum]
FRAEFEPPLKKTHHLDFLGGGEEEEVKSTSLGMVRISELSDELLIKILSFLPTKSAVSTGILSKQWEFLWTWLPKLEFDDYFITDDPDSILRFREFINKNLPLHKSPVIESLLLRHEDNLIEVVVNVPSLQRLTLEVYQRSSGGYVIVTPSLKYFKFVDFSETFSCLIEHIPKLEEADIRPVYSVSTIFNQLEHLKFGIYSDDWSKLLIWLLGNSPKLRVLNISIDHDPELDVYEPVTWSSVPECLLKTLETFEFKDYMATQEERDFLSFFFKHACCLTSTSIFHNVCDM